MGQLDWVQILVKNGFLSAKQHVYFNKEHKIGAWIGTVTGYNWVCYIASFDKDDGENVFNEKEFKKKLNNIIKNK